MNDLKERVLQFLYTQVSENKIPQIRKGMVEDFEKFVLDELTLADSGRAAARLNSLEAAKPVNIHAQDTNEKNS